MRSASIYATNIVECVVSARLSSRHSALILHFRIQDFSLEIQMENAWVHGWMHFYYIVLVYMSFSYTNFLLYWKCFPQVIVLIVTVLLRCNWPTYVIGHIWASQVAQWVKNPSAMQETQEVWVWPLGQEDHLEKEMATQIQYFCLENPMDRGAWWATVHRVAKRHDWATNAHRVLFCKSEPKGAQSVSVLIMQRCAPGLCRVCTFLINPRQRTREEKYTLLGEPTLIILLWLC